MGSGVPRMTASVAGSCAPSPGPSGNTLSSLTTPSSFLMEMPTPSMSSGNFRLLSMARKISPGAGSCLAEQAVRATASTPAVPPIAAIAAIEVTRANGSRARMDGSKLTEPLATTLEIRARSVTLRGPHQPVTGFSGRGMHHRLNPAHTLPEAQDCGSGAAPPGFTTWTCCWFAVGSGGPTERKAHDDPGSFSRAHVSRSAPSPGRRPAAAQAPARRRRPLRPPDQALEPEDAPVHLRRPQRHPHHRPRPDDPPLFARVPLRRGHGLQGRPPPHDRDEAPRHRRSSARKRRAPARTTSSTAGSAAPSPTSAPSSRAWSACASSSG